MDFKFTDPDAVSVGENNKEEIKVVFPGSYEDLSENSEITIPDSCVLVEFNCFYSCFSLEAVKLSDNMGMIDDCTFEGCRSLTTVDMPVRLKKIGRRAFAGCSSLVSLILPVGTSSIGLDAFFGCSSLSRIAIPKRLSEIEDTEIFDGCDSLADISVALADMRVDIVSINTQNLDGASIINMVISCKDINHFNSIVSRVRNIKDVIRVTRVLGAST